MRLRWVFAPLAALVVVALVCTGLYLWPKPSPLKASKLSPASCLYPGVVDAVISQATLDIPKSDDAGSRPDGFVAVSVVVCTSGGPTSAPEGTTATVRQATYVGDVSRVQDALDRREYRFRLFTTCDGDYPSVPVVWLIDNDGVGYRPTFPTDRCGRPITEPLTLIEELTLISSTETEIGLTR